MCFNAPVSMATYLIGLTGSLCLYRSGYIPEAIFYGWVIHMQLIEFFLWKLQPCTDPEKEALNRIVTKIGIIINHLEPVVLWLAILFFSRIKLPSVFNVLMIIFIIMTWSYTNQVMKSNDCTTVTKKSAPHLYWKWNGETHHAVYYAFFLMTLVSLSYYGLPKGHINASIVLISFMISFVIYRGQNAFGTMWCFAAAFASFTLLYFY